MIYETKNCKKSQKETLAEKFVSYHRATHTKKFMHVHVFAGIRELSVNEGRTLMSKIDLLKYVSTSFLEELIGKVFGKGSQTLNYLSFNLETLPFFIFCNRFLIM